MCENHLDEYDIISYTFNLPLYVESSANYCENELKSAEDCLKHNMKFIQICADIDCPSEGKVFDLILNRQEIMS